MEEIIFELLKCTVIVVTILITRYLVPYLKMRVDEYKNDKVVGWVFEAVNWAEQTIKASGKGEQKKQMVFEFVSNLAYNNGWNITSEQIDILIESAVFAMKEDK